MDSAQSCDYTVLLIGILKCLPDDVLHEEGPYNTHGCVLLQSPLFPLYDKLDADNLASSLTTLFKQLDQSIDQLEASQYASWQATVDPFERISDRMNVAWGVVDHLQASAMQESSYLPDGLFWVC